MFWDCGKSCGSKKCTLLTDNTLTSTLTDVPGMFRRSFTRYMIGFRGINVNVSWHWSSSGRCSRVSREIRQVLVGHQIMNVGIEYISYNVMYVNMSCIPCDLSRRFILFKMVGWLVPHTGSTGTWTLKAFEGLAVNQTWGKSSHLHICNTTLTARRHELLW